MPKTPMKTWKIFPDDHQWAEDEAKRVARLSGEKVQQWNFFRLMCRRYLATTPEAKEHPDPKIASLVPPKLSSHQNSEPSSHGTGPEIVINNTIAGYGKLTDEEVAWVRRLLKILRSGNGEFINAVQPNLLIFSRYCNGEPGPDDETGADTIEPAGETGTGKSGGIAAAHIEPPPNLQDAVQEFNAESSHREQPERKRDSN